MKSLTIQFTKLVLLVSIICISTLSYSQISYVDGNPYGYGSEEKSKIEFKNMPIVDNDKEEAKESLNANDKSKPYRFGVKHTVDLGIDNCGSWQTLKNGDRIWKLGIRAKGAKSINLIFSEYELPEGANLYMYNSSKSHFIGGFNHRNNKKHGKLGTTLVRGDELIVEYYEPKKVKGKAKLRIGSVTHGFRDIFKTLQKNFGEADNCTININCPDAAGWNVQSRSVVMLMIGGFGFCSGTLVNNTANDETPYILTADHCVDGDDGSTWVYLFNWEAPTCANANPGNTNTVSGSIVRAQLATSDFALFEMDSKPPASYNVIYSGWTRSTTAATMYYGIGHPSGDIKKWNQETPMGTDGQYWETSPALNLGQTEPGSSGCGVWNQNGYLVGQLWGGAGWCNDVGLINTWGRFDKSWDNGGTPATRLKEWLDPGNTNIMDVEHYDPKTPGVLLACSFTSACNSATNGTATVKVSGNDPTFDIVWSNGASKSNMASLDTHAQTGLTGGTYTVTVTDNSNNTSTCSITNTGVDAFSISNTVVNAFDCELSCDGSIDLTVAGSSVGAQTAYVSDTGPGTFGDIADNDCDGDYYLGAGIPSLSYATIDENTISQICVSITHPNLSDLAFGITLDDGINWITMDLIDDSTLTGANITNACFTVGATNNITSGTAPYTGDWAVLTSGSNDFTKAGFIFDGFNVSQNWYINAWDCAAGNAGGTIDFLSVTFNDGTDNTTFEWSNINSTEDINSLCPATYTVTVTDNNSCSNTQAIGVSCPIGLEDHLDKDTRIYQDRPGRLRIDSKNTIRTVSVFDLSGKTIYQGKANNNTIDLSSSPTGIYFARINTDKGSIVRKVLLSQ